MPPYKFILLTGLPCSGKTTLAKALKGHLCDQNIPVCVLDGDELRKGLCNDLGFSLQDREENLRRLTEMGKLLVPSGIVCIASVIAPFAVQRQAMRDVFGAFFCEIYVKCDLDTCIARDVKGHYQKALQGEISDFTGISSAYERPALPDLVLETNVFSFEDCLHTCISFLGAHLR